MNKWSVSSRVIHRSATTLKLLTSEVNKIDDLITVAPAKGWNILGEQVSEQFLKLMCLKQEKCKDLSDFDKGQTFVVFSVCRG